MNQTKFILLHTQGCHLCEQALKLWQEQQSNLDLELQDIVDHQDLYERYSTTIPVIRNTIDGTDLNWPFDALQLQQFIQRTVC